MKNPFRTNPARALPVLLIAVALVLAAVGTRPTTVAARPHAQGGCAGNLLANPSFDGGSRKTESLGTSLSSAVSDGWVPWFVRGDATWNREPEFKVEQVAIGGDPARTRSGGQSMKWFTTWGTHTAGIYQRVAVPSGATVTFTVHGLIYTGEADGWDEGARTFRSDPVKSGNYRIWAGIDPGGAVPSSMGSHPPDSVVWSPASMTTDTWVPLSVSATARGGAVTVYAKGAPEWPVKHNDSWWEDACLVVGGSAPAAPAPAQQAAAAPTTAAAPEKAGEVVVPAVEPATGGGPRRGVAALGLVPGSARPAVAW